MPPSKGAMWFSSGRTKTGTATTKSRARDFSADTSPAKPDSLMATHDKSVSHHGSATDDQSDSEQWPLGGRKS